MRVIVVTFVLLSASLLLPGCVTEAGPDVGTVYGRATKPDKPKKMTSPKKEKIEEVPI